MKLKQADAELAAANVKLQNAEARRLSQLPRSERHSSFTAPPPEPTKEPLLVPMSLVPTGAAAVSAPILPTPRLTPDQVRESWWWRLTALALAEVFASVLAGAILFGCWEWDKNHNGIDDRLERGTAPGKI